MVGPARRRNMPRSIVPAVALLVSLATAAVGVHPAAAAPRKDPVLVVIDAHGGLCVSADGSGRVCQTITTIHRSGRWTITGAKRSGRFPFGETSELSNAIARTEFRPIRATVPDGGCNAAFDGTDISYTFTTRIGRIHVDPCTTPAAAQAPAVLAAERLRRALLG